jgi:hypothetical protein
MPVSLRRHMVDKIDDAVLQPADIEAVQHVDNEGGGVFGKGHGCI